MICTELLRSPYIEETDARCIEVLLQTRTAVDNALGHQIYCYTSGKLKGSFDHRVSVSVKRKIWVGYDDVRHPKTTKGPYEVPSLPYVTIEGSVHKAMMGHNVYGGPLCPIESALWFIEHVAECGWFHLPPGERWWFERVDIAEVFDVGSLAAAMEYKRALELARYSRRQPEIYEGTVMFPGSTSTWKMYIKGLEFKANDFNRVAAVMSKQKAEELQELANRLIRVEVSVKPRLLDEKIRLAGKSGNIGNETISREWLEQIWDKETSRVLEDGKHRMETVRNHDDVKRRLHEVYEGRLARTLYGTWSDLALSGEKYVREFMPGRTFRRHCKQLEDADVSWLGSDVFVGERSSLIPVGFSVVRSDPRRLVGESSEVVAALASYRRAA